MTSPGTLLSAWNIHAKKRLGQNFLKEPSLAEAIVRRCQLSDNDVIMEIGSGLGMLTVFLAEYAGHVIAIETDSRLIPLLRAELLSRGIDNVEVIHEDVLKADLTEIFIRCKTPVTVVANLPYGISSQVLVQLISKRKYIQKAVLMFQKEFADRLLSGPGSKSYGRLSVMLAYCAGVRRLLNVSADSFYPKPKIDSTVIEIVFLSNPAYPVADESFFVSVIKAAFGKRRKNLKNALSGSDLGVTSDTISKAFDHCGIDRTRRAETLSVNEFGLLSNCLMEAMKSGNNKDRNKR